MLGLVFTLVLSVVPAMPSASVTCPGWPASCDGAWGATAVDDSADAQAATDDGPRDYATPAEVDCPTTPDAPAVAPDILIVPLAAFDRAGHRIGYGAGYYDMTIHALRAKKTIVTVGIAFAAQEIARVPATERDERLDLVLTERGVIDFRGT